MASIESGLPNFDKIVAILLGDYSEGIQSCLSDLAIAVRVWRGSDDYAWVEDQDLLISFLAYFVRRFIKLYLSSKSEVKNQAGGGMDEDEISEIYASQLTTEIAILSYHTWDQCKLPEDRRRECRCYYRRVDVTGVPTREDINRIAYFGNTISLFRGDKLHPREACCKH